MKHISQCLMLRETQSCLINSIKLFFFWMHECREHLQMFCQRILKYSLLFSCLHSLADQLLTNVVKKCKVDRVWTHNIILTICMLDTAKVNQCHFNILRAFKNLLHHFLHNSVQLIIRKWFYREVIIWVIFKVWLLIIT